MAAAAAAAISLPALLPSSSLSRQQRQRQPHRPLLSIPRQPPALLPPVLSLPHAPLLRRHRLPCLIRFRASAQGGGRDSGEELDVPEASPESATSAAGRENAEAAEAAEAAARRILSERRGGGGGDGLWSGVAEEVQEIEWPALGKVLGTTGVVLAVIAGSSVALLTVNAVLAELSDRAFAGRGVQDLFSG